VIQDFGAIAGELLAETGPAVSDLFCAAAKRGVVVRGLVWRSHLYQWMTEWLTERMTESTWTWVRSRLSGRRRPGLTPGMTAAGKDPGRPDSCAATTFRSCPR
jgi:hypothetical protein